MKVVIQRVSKASVTVDQQLVASIEYGLVLLLGVATSDSEEDVNWLSKKVANLRIFNDQRGVMNLSLVQVRGEAIVVSQFTLQAATKKGNRPSYIRAAKPDIALPLYKSFVCQFQKEIGKKVQTGRFGADMHLEIHNAGPVTIVIDSKNRI